MYQIDREAFGRFLAEKRKERKMTQKQLAQQLFVSDKAVSKWERGLSLPDITLLTPLAKALDVTVVELLQAKDQPKNQSLSVEEVEKLVTGSLAMASQEQQRDRSHWKRRALLWAVCLAVTGLEFLILYLLGFKTFLSDGTFWTFEILAFLFGSCFCLTRRTRLPAYYDENKISLVSTGFLRLHIIGLHFNNRNWPHILRAGRIWGMAAELLLPLLYGPPAEVSPALLPRFRMVYLFLFLFTLFGALVWIGKKYE